MIENNHRLSAGTGTEMLKCKEPFRHISCCFKGFLQFYRKKVAKSDRLNVFIVTFATLI